MILTDKNTLSNRYIRRKIEQYKIKKATLVSSDNPIKHVELRKKLHPWLIKLLQIKSKLMGLTYEFIGNEKSCIQDKTVIYALTHIGKFDYEMVVEACNIFAYPFAGDWETMYATVDDYFLRLNGVLYVDTGDKKDRQNSCRYMMKALKQGIPVLIYPEGIWNLTENLPMLKLFPGAVQAAQECHVPIVPIAIEQIGKHFVINAGKELNFEGIEEIKAVEILRNTLASLKWEIWEHLPLVKRADIPLDYYENFLQERFKEYPPFNMKVIDGRIYREKIDREILAIQHDLRKLRKKQIKGVGL